MKVRVAHVWSWHSWKLKVQVFNKKTRAVAGFACIAEWRRHNRSVWCVRRVLLTIYLNVSHAYRMTFILSLQSTSYLLQRAGKVKQVTAKTLISTSYVLAFCTFTRLSTQIAERK